MQVDLWISSPDAGNGIESFYAIYHPTGSRTANLKIGGVPNTVTQYTFGGPTNPLLYGGINKNTFNPDYFAVAVFFRDPSLGFGEIARLRWHKVRVTVYWICDESSFSSSSSSLNSSSSSSSSSLSISSASSGSSSSISSGSSSVSSAVVKFPASKVVVVVGPVSSSVSSIGPASSSGEKIGPGSKRIESPT